MNVLKWWSVPSSPTSYKTHKGTSVKPAMRCRVIWAHTSQMNPFEFYHYALSFQTRESVYEDVIRRADISQDKDLHLLLWSACWESVGAGRPGRLESVCKDLLPWHLLRADEDGSAGREVAKVNWLEKRGRKRLNHSTNWQSKRQMCIFH